MILFFTPNSPYARTARIALREWGVLEAAEERLATNRQVDNPVLQFSPVGRVPTLVHNGLVITEARSVFAYIRDIAGAGNAEWTSPADWAAIADEGQISGFLEGIAFWVRENRRSVAERSGFLLKVERNRTLRCLDYIDTLATTRPLPTVKEFRGAALASALHLMDVHRFYPDWKMNNKALGAWFEHQLDRQSMRETAPHV
ncbi:glutathione S-transferase family protein [Chelativorans sp. YIM 93263]|uniref:glutathione S-transferase family protein n=1 Tax=Chelativorans sp. YIM 93263 TaxID=2906648 RepID=UPI0023796E38|nr:glutathione S-transferase family protein [Chelativorans sp. YIM 93263]